MRTKKRTSITDRSKVGQSGRHATAAGNALLVFHCLLLTNKGCFGEQGAVLRGGLFHGLSIFDTMTQASNTASKRAIAVGAGLIGLECAPRVLEGDDHGSSKQAHGCLRLIWM